MHLSGSFYSNMFTVSKYFPKLFDPSTTSYFTAPSCSHLVGFNSWFSKKYISVFLFCKHERSPYLLKMCLLMLLMMLDSISEHRYSVFCI